MWHSGHRWFGVNHYVFLDRIHKGITAEVWRAYSVKDKQLYAIKVLCTSLLQSTPAVIFAPDSDDIELITEWDRCMKELRILKRLAKSQNIVQVIETINCPDPEDPWQSKSETYDNQSPAFIVLEWLPERLAEYVKDESYDRTVASADDFWLIAGQLLQIAQLLQDENICHKDLKPENLLFTKPRTLKIPEIESFQGTRDMAGHPFLLLEQKKQICPYDLEDVIVVNVGQQISSREQRLTCIDFNVSAEDLVICDCEGTNAFTPPEALLKKSPTFDGSKRDLWSIGVILFVLLTKELPFHHEIPIYLQFLIISEDIDWENQKIPPGSEFQPCVTLCQMLLKKDPEERCDVRTACEYLAKYKLSNKTLEELTFLL